MWSFYAHTVTVLISHFLSISNCYSTTVPIKINTEEGFLYDLPLPLSSTQTRKMLTEIVTSPGRRIRFTRTCASNPNNNHQTNSDEKGKRKKQCRHNRTDSQERVVTYAQSSLAADNTQATRRRSCCVCTYQLMTDDMYTNNRQAARREYKHLSTV